MFVRVSGASQSLDAGSLNVVSQFPNPELKVSLVHIGPVVNQAPDPVPRDERDLFHGFASIPTNHLCWFLPVVEEPPP